MGLCKIIIESANKVSETWIEVLTFAGGWHIDSNFYLNSDETESEEAKTRSEELEMIRNTDVPRAVFMLHEIFDKTGTMIFQNIT